MIVGIADGGGAQVGQFHRAGGEGTVGNLRSVGVGIRKGEITIIDMVDVARDPGRLEIGVAVAAQNLQADHRLIARQGRAIGIAATIDDGPASSSSKSGVSRQAATVLWLV